MPPKSVSRKRTYKRKTFSRKRQLTKKRSYKRKYVARKRARMPAPHTRSVGGFRKLPGLGDARRGHYKLSTEWLSGPITHATVAGTPAMFCTAINWNTLDSTTMMTDASNTFGFNTTFRQPYEGLAALQLRFRSTLVVAYRLTVMDLECNEGLDQACPMHVTLCPIDQAQWALNFTGSAPLLQWPGSNVSGKWSNMIDQPGCTKPQEVGCLSGGDKGERMARQSCGTNMATLVQDPMWSAPSYGISPFSEYNASPIAAGYRQKMILTHVFFNPSQTVTRQFSCRYKEEVWVKCWDAEMPGLLQEATEVGTKAAKEYLESLREEKKSTGGGFVEPEGDYEDLSLAPLHVEESKTPLSLLPLVRTPAKPPTTPAPRMGASALGVSRGAKL